MFEREIKFIYDFNLNKVNKLGPYFTFEQLQNSDIHPAILHYISAEIDYLVFEDRQKLLKNSVFDYSGEKISHYFTLITEELKKNKRFSLEYIAKLILHATSFTINFLVRPRWTVTRFIFDESKHKTTNEIKQILNYIYYYKYLKTIIISYINTKKILSMNIEEFDELISKTEKLSIESNFSGVISNSLIAMAEFFNIGQVQKTRVPLSAVELFLEEKNLPEHLQKINEILGTDENAIYHISDYMKILNSVALAKEEIIDESKEPEFSFDKKSEEIYIDESDVENENFFPDDNSQLDLNINEELKNENLDELNNELIHKNSVDEIESTPHNKDEDTKKDLIDISFDENYNNEIIEIDEYNGFSDEEIEELREEKNILSESEDNNEKLLIENSLDQDYEYGQDKGLEKDNENEQDNLNIEQDYVSSQEEKYNTDDNEIEKEISYEINNEQNIIQEEKKKLELTEIIEHKDVSKIIEVIFDYDFEDFSNSIEEIAKCKNIDDALLTINKILSKRKINNNSKEAESLREIITEYFNQ